MAHLERLIRGITLDGIIWGEQFKVVDVAFGIQKLVIQFVMSGEVSGLTEVEDSIMALNPPKPPKADDAEEDEDDDKDDLVSSVDLCTMNRL